MTENEIIELSRHYMNPQVSAIALLGSRAQGNPCAHSDVDFWRLTATQDCDGAGSHFVADTLINISNVTEAGAESWFTDPALATVVIAGVRRALIISDPQGKFAALQARAQAFAWNDDLKRQASAYVGREMVGWIEEAFKGISGLQRNDPGRLVNARLGLSWGLNKVMRVHLGVLSHGDNDVLESVTAAAGHDSEWSQLHLRAFGISPTPIPPTLREQVIAGLQLYLLTARLVRSSISIEHRKTIDTAVRIITAALQEGLTE